MTTTWMLAHDLSPSGRFALTFAAELLARGGGGRLVVVHANSAGTLHVGDDDFPVLGSDVDLERDVVAAARRTLDDELRAVQAPTLELEARIVEGRPADVITELAAAERPELVIVGTRGPRGLERVFLGSVAEAVVRRAPCPVLVARHR